MPAGPGSHGPVASLEGRREEGPGDRRRVGSGFVQNRFSVTSQHPSKPVSCRPEVRTVLANSGSAPSRCCRSLSPRCTQPSPRRASGHVTPLESSGQFPHQRSRDRKAGGFLGGGSPKRVKGPGPQGRLRMGPSHALAHGGSRGPGRWWLWPLPSRGRLSGSLAAAVPTATAVWSLRPGRGLHAAHHLRGGRRCVSGWLRLRPSGHAGDRVPAASTRGPPGGRNGATMLCAPISG